ncbi:hypothetical protein [Cohnella sp.]|uniref:hypothetical protein n=1 Tax=Cohnella sp. TaxID=1883426 RepID=UPI0037038D21
MLLQALNRSGLVLYSGLYFVLWAAYMALKSPWPAAIGAVSALLFLLVAFFGTGMREKRKSVRYYRIFAVAYLAVAALALWGLAPLFMLVLCSAIGLLGLAVWHWQEKGAGGRFIPVALTVAALLAAPVPGQYTIDPASPSEYAVPGKAGVLKAPNTMKRPTQAGEWALSAASVADAAPAKRLALIEGEAGQDFGDLFQLPYDIPETYYQWEGADSDPHALIRTLAKWNAESELDVTQGQKVMGVGTVLPDGRIGMVDRIEAYTRSAIEEGPDVFFVPVEAYQQVKDISKKQLIVPVSNFAEVLYFLEQPIEFWPLRNFGLFCH